MDRLKITMAGCGLAALLAASGCRNLRSEVPAGRPYSSDGRQMPPVGFSSDPHPMVGGAAMPPPGTPGMGAPGMGAPGMGSPSMGATEPSSMPGQYGTPSPGSTGNFGQPSNNAYGRPGTALGSGAAADNGASAATYDPAGMAPAMPSTPPSLGPGVAGPR